MSSIQSCARNVEYVCHGGEVTGCSGVLFAVHVLEKIGLRGLLKGAERYIEKAQARYDGRLGKIDEGPTTTSR